MHNIFYLLLSLLGSGTSPVRWRFAALTSTWRGSDAIPEGLEGNTGIAFAGSEPKLRVIKSLAVDLEGAGPRPGTHLWAGVKSVCSGGGRNALFLTLYLLLIKQTRRKILKFILLGWF